MCILLPHFRNTIRALNLSGKSVLDLACGTGVLLAKAASLGASRLVGVDISAGMIAVAAHQHARTFEPSSQSNHLRSKTIGTLSTWFISCLEQSNQLIMG
jgi:2-polyprenyl-3-methyl-5-hydroxy-6-metoxy-1,4-benzoquinol methylase